MLEEIFEKIQCLPDVADETKWQALAEEWREIVWPLLSSLYFSPESKEKVFEIAAKEYIKDAKNLAIRLLLFDLDLIALKINAQLKPSADDFPDILVDLLIKSNADVQAINKLRKFLEMLDNTMPDYYRRNVSTGYYIILWLTSIEGSLNKIKENDRKPESKNPEYSKKIQASEEKANQFEPSCGKKYLEIIQNRYYKMVAEKQINDFIIKNAIRLKPTKRKSRIGPSIMSAFQTDPLKKKLAILSAGVRKIYNATFENKIQQAIVKVTERTNRVGNSKPPLIDANVDFKYKFYLAIYCANKDSGDDIKRFMQHLQANLAGIAPETAVAGLGAGAVNGPDPGSAGPGPGVQRKP